MALPVHFNLPVELVGDRNPGDGVIVVVRVNTTEGYHTTLCRVTKEESQNLLNDSLCSIFKSTVSKAHLRRGARALMGRGFT